MVDDKIMAGPFRGFRQADVDSSSLGDELKKTLLNMANHDPFMRKLLGRREQSRKDGERLKVRQEEREKLLKEAKLAVAAEVREEVRAEALVELQPELESMEVLKERARFEVMAELQEERKGIDEERAAMERERDRIRDEEQANVRREMMMNVIGGGDGSVGAGGGIAVAERVAVEGGGGHGSALEDDIEPPGYGGGPVDVPDDGPDESVGVAGEDGVFEDGTGYVAFGEAEFGVYEGPDEYGRGGGDPGEFKRVVEPEAVVEQKSREEWLTVAGVELRESPVREDVPADSGDVVMDRNAVEDYISGLGRSGGGAGVGKGQNGTREGGGGSEREELSDGDGHASVSAVLSGDGDDRGVEGTGGLKDAVEGVEEEVPSDAREPADGAGADGEGDGVDCERAGSEDVAEVDGEPLAIPQVVGELDEGGAGGDVPELSDVLSDIGQASLEDSDPYRTKPAPKFFRHGDSGGDRT